MGTEIGHNDELLLNGGLNSIGGYTEPDYGMY